MTRGLTSCSGIKNSDTSMPMEEMVDSIVWNSFTCEVVRPVYSLMESPEVFCRNAVSRERHRSSLSKLISVTVV